MPPPAAWNVQVAGVLAARTGELYQRTLTATNATAPVWQTVQVRRDTGSPSFNRYFWYPKAEFVPIHDEDGNLLDDGRWLYTWDAENRLIQMETTTAATTALHPYTKLVFAYDWQGRRTGRHVWQGGTKTSPTFKSSTRWLYDGWNPVAEFTATAVTATSITRARAYTWGLDLSGSLQGAGGVGGLLSALTVSGGAKHAPSYDGNGNIVAWTLSTLLAPASRREYDAFGNTVVSEGTAPNSFGFSTKPQDVETGLYYYGYRYYDPVTGRWPSKDPIEEKGGLALYSFNENNAISRFDRLGLESRGQGQNLVDKHWNKCKKERSKLERKMDQLVTHGNTSPDCSGEEGCELVTIVIEIGDPCANLDPFTGKFDKLVGHTGVGIGGEYFDLGPTLGQGNGSIAGTWWDNPQHPSWNNKPPGDNSDDIDLEDIEDNIDGLATNPTYKAQLCSCKGRASKYWNSVYAMMKNDEIRYQVPGVQCTSVACHSVSFGSRITVNLSPQSFLESLNPSGVAEMLQEYPIRSSCGVNKGQKPVISKMKSGYDWNDR